MASLKPSWCSLAILAALTWQASALSDHPRLRETNLNRGLLGRKLPVDPDGEDGPKRIAGYFALNRTEAAEMFYFFFESRSDPENDPVVLWMTGGPGCSSELAVFYENGPFKIQDDLTLTDNPYGWDVSHSLIYVDQPIGTGYSYSDDPADTVHSEKGVAIDMLDFLQEFMAAHPELADNDFYVTGESYAGHYVPAVSHRLWQFNKAGSGQHIPFKGFAIGNGLTDPVIQYGAYADFAMLNSLITKPQRDLIMRNYPGCKVAIEHCNAGGDARMCEHAKMLCGGTIFDSILFQIGRSINYYDIRKPCVGPLCYDFSLLPKFLAQPDVQKALGVEDRSPWHSCDHDVYANFAADWMLDCADMIPEMLEDGIRGMIYAGDQDLICNWLGNRRWVDALQWAGAGDWAAAEDCEWEVEGSAAGSIRQAGTLSFVKVYKAGHMVPMDKGENSLDMLQHLTRDKQFECAERAGPAVDTASTFLPRGSMLSRDTIVAAES
eukprot:jgi/Ulvmu1/6813/UM031_0016.1